MLYYIKSERFEPFRLNLVEDVEHNKCRNSNNNSCLNSQKEDYKEQSQTERRKFSHNQSSILSKELVFNNP